MMHILYMLYIYTYTFVCMHAYIIFISLYCMMEQRFEIMVMNITMQRQCTEYIYSHLSFKYLAYSKGRSEAPTLIKKEKYYGTNSLYY